MSQKPNFGELWLVSFLLVTCLIALVKSHAEERERQRREAEAERQRSEEKASKGKEFIFEIITVDGKGKPSSKKSGKGYQKDEDLGNGVKLEMVYIPAGSFMMGSPSGEGDNDERPQHQVNFAQPFYLGKYPITQEQYQAVMGNNPSSFKGAKRPVQNVSWNKALNFCQKLSEKTGKTYRLPSESQWEYACRAGTTTPFHFGETITSDLVNYDGNTPCAWAPKGFYREQTTDVGSFPPNAFGLYDMHGNVWEWCSDRYHFNYNDAPSDGSSWETGGNDYRVQRGGSWYDPAVYCRSAYRLRFSMELEDWLWGFRVALASDLPASTSSASDLPASTSSASDLPASTSSASDLPASPSEMRDLFISFSVLSLFTLFLFNIFSFLFHLIFG